MKRRGFFGAFAGLIAAPVAVKALESVPESVALDDNEDDYCSVSASEDDWYSACVLGGRQNDQRRGPLGPLPLQGQHHAHDGGDYTASAWVDTPIDDGIPRRFRKYYVGSDR